MSSKETGTQTSEQPHVLSQHHAPTRNSSLLKRQVSNSSSASQPNCALPSLSRLSESKEIVDYKLDSHYQFDDLSKANEFITHLQAEISNLNEKSKTLEDKEKELVSQISTLFDQNFTLTNQLNTSEASRNSLQEENVQLKKKCDELVKVWNEFPPMYKKEILNWSWRGKVKISDLDSLIQDKRTLENLHYNLIQEKTKLEIEHHNLEQAYQFLAKEKKDLDQLVNTFRSRNDDKKKEIEALKDTVSKSGSEISELRNQIVTSDGQLKGFEISLVITMFNKSSQNVKALLRYTKYGALLYIYDFIRHSVNLGRMMIKDRLECTLNATCGLGEDPDNEKLKERMLKFSKSVMQANVKKIFHEIHESSISLTKLINTFSQDQIDVNPFAWTQNEIYKLGVNITHEAQNSVESGKFDLSQFQEKLNEMQKIFMEVSVYAFLADPSLEIGPSDNQDSINKRDYMRTASFMNKIPQSVKEAIEKIPILPVLPGLYIRGEDGSITFKEKYFVSDVSVKDTDMETY
ncbi:hypothetical protein HK096_001441 [Nowakowskiella sp. JEL0078]|nr:hypothetical protein HK096_001441 [Nowakowskiella sp. JEL0078]